MKRPGDTSDQKPKREKFDFEKMKFEATHKDLAVRKRIFIEYFERFEEFPSYLFDNEHRIDDRLSETIKDLLADPEATKELKKALSTLLLRLPASA